VGAKKAVRAVARVGCGVVVGVFCMFKYLVCVVGLFCLELFVRLDSLSALRRFSLAGNTRKTQNFTLSVNSAYCQTMLLTKKHTKTQLNSK